MTDSTPSLTTRRALLASICLCLVAGLHAVRVYAYGQTPWKGGGFGMFSTVDSETTRFLRIYLLTQDGDEIPVSLPAEFEHRALELRAAPNAGHAKDLAQLLVNRRWRQSEERWQHIADAAAQQAESGPVTAAALHSVAQHASSLTLKPSTWEPLPPSETSGRAFTGARLEIWRWRFDAATAQIQTERVLTVSVTRAQEW